ncbi:DUF6907 domain-containing protein [Streptomyces tendae]|uniref:DUF1876 domain-containing protein n=1 Tax=Streptomyces tendae TaxID=1932 RepID=A0ABX5ZWQ7_STRTE|nr:hypothetical protein [Streptomyces tendae]QER88615.1 hypothetical protein F3L20_24630 [Streptomyces tendae]
MAQSAISQHTAALAGIPSQPTAADKSQPTLKPGFRLVPALIGTRKASHTAWIPCPSWCVEDHTAEPYQLEDITHASKSEDVGISSFLKPNGDLLMFAMLQADPAATDSRLRQAHIAVEAGDMPEYHTPEMAEALADDLIAFASSLRHLARAARLHNASQGAELRGEAV